MAVSKGKIQAGLREHESALAAALASPPACIAIAGDNEYLRAAAVSALRDGWLAAHPAGDIATLRGTGEARTVRTADITAELSGASLFAREKLVIVRQAEKILFPKAGADEEDDAPAPAGKAGGREEALLACLESPDTGKWLILETAALPQNRKLGKRLAALCSLIPCPLLTLREAPAFLNSRAAACGRRLDPEAADILVRAHGTDAGVLTAEMEKLDLYAGAGQDIDAPMAEQFLSGTIEFDVFGLTNAIEAGDSAAALFFARRITQQGTRDQKGKREDGEKSSHRIMALAAGTVQNLLQARVALALGESPDAFAARAKLPPWRAEKVLGASRKFSLRDLRLLTAFVSDVIRQTHDTGGDAALALEMLAVKCTAPEML